jgi:tripartite-type tricarboxylate transporter receptor subunit TctC
MVAKFVCALAASLMILAPGASQAQAYPTKPIRLVVPFAPGGTNDILARMIAADLLEAWGQTVIPDNRPGHQGIIGTNIAANADPDGYTLVVISAAYTMNPITEKMPFDPVKALDFVIRIGQSVLIMNVGPMLPNVKSVKDLLIEAERKPGSVVQLRYSRAFRSMISTSFFTRAVFLQ